MGLHFFISSGMPLFFKIKVSMPCLIFFFLYIILKEEIVK